MLQNRPDEDEELEMLMMMEDADRRRGKGGGSIFGTLFVILVVCAVLDAIFESVVLTIILCVLVAAAIAAFIAYKVRSKQIRARKVQPTKLDRVLFRLAGAASGARYGWKNKKTKGQAQKEYEMTHDYNDDDPRS